MDPIITTVELAGVEHPVAGYGLCLAVAILLGGALLLRGAHRERLDVGAVIAALGGAVVGGFAGAYVLAVSVAVAGGAEPAAALRTGGLVFYGGLLGGVAGLSLVARAMDVPAVRLLDLSAVPLLVSHAIGRVGCLLGGCCYGSPSAAPWAVTFTHPLAPAAAEPIARHPVQLYEAAALLLVAGVFARPWPFRRTGARFATYLLAYGGVRLVTELWRGDPARGHLLPALSTSQAVSIVLVVAAALWLRGAFVWRRPPGYTGGVSRRTAGLLLLSLSLAGAALWAPAGSRAADPSASARMRAAARVFIGSGHFPMGSDEAAVETAVTICRLDPLLADACRAGMFADERPRHRVHLARHGIDRTEVDNASYRRCVAASHCTPASVEAGDVRLGMPRQPVTGVTFEQAQRYCAFVGGRLPTEAQWERAARAGSPRAFPWGAHFNPSLANFGTADGKPDPIDGYRYAAPVDAYPDGRSAYGLLNMAGNVWEWTADHYADDYYGRSPAVEPSGPKTGDGHVVRGGSWRSPPHTLRVSQRRKLAAGEVRPDVGFRCVYPDRT